MSDMPQKSKVASRMSNVMVSLTFDVGLSTLDFCGISDIKAQSSI